MIFTNLVNNTIFKTFKRSVFKASQVILLRPKVFPIFDGLNLTEIRHFFSSRLQIVKYIDSVLYTKVLFLYIKAHDSLSSSR